MFPLNSHHVPSRRRGWLRAVAAAPMLAALWVTPGWGQELRGLVALADSTPVASAIVELHRVSEETGVLVDSTVTDASGRFAFVFQSDEDLGVVFLAGARHGGVLYWGPPVHASNPADSDDYAVVVFDTTAVSGPVPSLRASIRHVVITPATRGLQIEEIIDVEGMPERTIVGEADSVLVWTTSLARDAHGAVSLAGGVPPEDLALGEGSVGFRGALPPSGIRIVLQYVVPSSEYTLRLDHATARLELLVMLQPGLEIQVSGLEEAPVGDGMRVSVRRFTGVDLPDGSAVAVRAEIERPRRGRAWMWFMVSLALGAAALLSVRFNARRNALVT